MRNFDPNHRGVEEEEERGILFYDSVLSSQYLDKNICFMEIRDSLVAIRMSWSFNFTPHWRKFHGRDNDECLMMWVLQTNTNAAEHSEFGAN